MDSGVPAGYTLTKDPEGAANGEAQVTLATGEKRLDIDFGYQPGGSGSIGDTVFDDKGNDGTFNGADVGIPNVTVNLYEDTNGNGVIDAGDALIGTTSTNGSGVYSFPNLAEGLSYIVDVDQADPDIATYFGGGVIQQSTVDPRPVQGLTGAYTTADFGFYKVVPGSIGDKVWYDADADGVVDAERVRPGQCGRQALPGHQRQRRGGCGRAAAGHDDHRRQRRLHLHQPAGGHLRRGCGPDRPRRPGLAGAFSRPHRRDAGRGPGQDRRGLPLRPGADQDG